MPTYLQTNLMHSGSIKLKKKDTEKGFCGSSVSRQRGSESSKKKRKRTPDQLEIPFKAIDKHETKTHETKTQKEDSPYTRKVQELEEMIDEETDQD